VQWLGKGVTPFRKKIGPNKKKLFKIARVFEGKKLFSTPLPLSKNSGYATAIVGYFWNNFQ